MSFRTCIPETYIFGHTLSSDYDAYRDVIVIRTLFQHYDGKQNCPTEDSVECKELVFCKTQDTAQSQEMF
jgi:hypothetical protein